VSILVDGRGIGRFHLRSQTHREDDLHVAEEYSLSASRRREYMFSDQQGLGASLASEFC